MAYSQSDIDKLKAAIATGALEVEFGAGPDKQRVKYRNLADMERSLALMIAEVTPSAAAPLRTVGRFFDGLFPRHHEHWDRE